MKKGKKLLGLGMLMMVVLFVLGACGGDFDARGYVKSTLDATTRAEFDEYVELTDSSTEEAEEMYQESVDTFMAEFESVGLSEELTANYRELFENALSLTKYEVGEAVKDGDDFTVPVEMEPFKLFEGFDEEVAAFQEELMAEMAAITDESAIPDEAEITERVFQAMYDTLNKQIENPTYGEKVTIEVPVTKGSGNIYEVSDSDLEELGNLLIEVEL